MNNKKLHWILLAGILVIACILPLLINQYLLNVLTSVLMTALLGQSWNILSGYSGQFSFGQAMFFGIGAYTGVVLYTQFGISPWVGMVVGMALSALFGCVIGYLSIRCRIKGDFFALITLAFAEILRLCVYHSGGTMFGGPAGIFVKYIKGGSPENFQFRSFLPYYYIVLILVVAASLSLAALSKTRFGIKLTAVRENENAADALGVNVVQYKLAAIAASAAIASAAGTFYAQYYLFVDPDSVFGSAISIQAIIPCIIGGVGTVIGPVIGAFLIVPLQELTGSLFVNVSGVNMILYGMLIVLFILFCPNGIVGTVKKHLRKTGKEKPNDCPDSEKRM